MPRETLSEFREFRTLEELGTQKTITTNGRYKGSQGIQGTQLRINPVAVVSENQQRAASV